MPAKKIWETALLLAHNRPVSMYMWNGLGQHTNATQTSRANACLYALLGDFDRPGGNVIFPKVKVNEVDGKEFFGNDPQIATKNLPADAVDKVQVFDKKSDRAEFTGVDDGQRARTINLELKDDKKQGVFGNATAGAGTDQRYEGRFSLNRFSKRYQIAGIGMLNNTNQAGFSFDDYLGFLEVQLHDRETHRYPPFARLIEITLKQTEKPTVTNAAQKLATYLKENLQGVRIMGPGEPMVSRVRNEYLMTILVKIPRNQGKLPEIKSQLENAAEKLVEEKSFRKVRVIFDVDPV